jgi:hypothetical protein
MHKLLTNMKKIQTITSLGVLLALLAILVGLPLQVVYAAALLNKSDTMSSLKDNTASNHEIIFRTPTGVDASTDTITIEFDTTGTAFNLGTVAFGDMDLDVSAGGQTSCSGVAFGTSKTLAATAGVSIWGVGVNVTTDIITLTAPTNAASGEIAVNACARIRIGTNAAGGANRITNPDITVATNYIIQFAGAFGDTGDIVIQIILDDQVAVSGTVSESMTFSLGATSVALGTLSSATVTSGSHTVTLSTNAASGMVLTYSGTTLTLGGNTITAMSTAAASSVGTEQFGINSKSNTVPSVGAECSGTSPIAAAATGYAVANNFKFVSGETVISSSAGINSTACTISYIANISGATEAGSYTTALTFTATATF